MTLTMLMVAGAGYAPVVMAQDSSAPRTELERAIDRTVYVTDRAGTEVEGRLLSAAAEAVVLQTQQGERRFSLGDVSRIQKRDLKKNGALIGLGIGVGMGLLSAGISDCPGADPGGRCPGFRAATAVTGAAVYAALGAGIDALVRGRKTIYPGASPTFSSPTFSSPTFSSPAISSTRRGAAARGGNGRQHSR